MKRSLINAKIALAKRVLQQLHFTLPPFAYWTMDEWKQKGSCIEMIRRTMLGWDITDFSSGDFERVGAVLFTLRNGDAYDPAIGTPYAEKIIVVQNGQILPLHKHMKKTEDIINRGGGTMLMTLYGSDSSGGVDRESDVQVYCDGELKTYGAGETFEVPAGASVTLTPGIYHLFGARCEGEAMLIGEVSSVNDDNTDNYWAEKRERFSSLEEDEAALCPLCNEYDSFL